MVNTEPSGLTPATTYYYNILNIVVNTELIYKKYIRMKHYNILNIVVNTELKCRKIKYFADYNILNIVVNTEQIKT